MKYETDSCMWALGDSVFYSIRISPLALNQSHSLYVNLISLQQTNTFIVFFPFDSP